MHSKIITIKKIALLICFGLLLFNCKHIYRNKSVAIKIGSVNITYDQIKREFIKYRDNFERTKNTNLPKVMAEKWLDNYIEELYPLAEAYQLNYNNEDIHRMADLVEKMMIAAPNSEYLDSFLYKSIEITQDEIDEAFIKSLKLYEIECLKFRTRKEMYEALGGDTTINGLEKFNEFVEKFEKTDHYIKKKTKFPFLHFPGLCTMLDTLDLNKVSIPIEDHDGPYFTAFYIVYKKEIEDDYEGKVSAYQMKKSLKNAMRKSESTKVLFDKIKEFLDNSEYEINKELAWELYTNYQKYDTILIIEEMIAEIDEEVILKYKIDDKQKQVKVNELAFAYENYFFRNKIKSYKELLEVILDQMIFDYFFMEAEKNGFTNNKDFKIGKENFINNQIKYKYLWDSVYSKITISEDEMLEMYNLNSSMFKDGSEAEIGLLYFKNKDEALKSTFDIRENRPQTFEKDSIVNIAWNRVIKYDFDVYVSRNDDQFNEEIKNKIFSMNDREVSKPYEFNGDIFIILKKRELGTYLYPLNTVKKEVKQMVMAKKEPLALEEQIDYLKTKYKPKVKNKIISFFGYE